MQELILKFMAMRIILTIGLLSAFLVGCGPYQDITLRNVRNIKVESVSGELAKLKADVNLHNPNNVRVRLKKIRVDVFVDGKKSAVTDQKLKSTIKAKSDFTVPLEMMISLKELGLLDTILSLIGGKRYQLHYQGYIRLKIRGVPVKVPVDYKDEVRLRF